jgi:tetratricopeptide (TPR) repeat protein
VLTSVTQAQKSVEAGDCRVHWERATSYLVFNDDRAEQEFRIALRDGDQRCVDSMIEFTYYLSGRLRFGEAADILQQYVDKTPRQNHQGDLKRIAVFRNAVNIQKRLKHAVIPSLSDLIAFAKLAEGYGRRKPAEGLPYAEKAVELYPSSVDALMLLAEMLIPMHTDDDRVELLLNQAVAIDPDNARVRSTRGWFLLFSRDRAADAEKEFQRALELDDKDRTAWKGMGYCLMFKGQKKQALSAFAKYMSLKKPGETNTEIPMIVEQLKADSDP